MVPEIATARGLRAASEFSVVISGRGVPEFREEVLYVMNTLRLRAVFRGNDLFCSLPATVPGSKERHSRPPEKENFPVV